MRFLLDGDAGRFRRQLLSRLLEEGCNLPMPIAQPLFRERIVSILSSEGDLPGPTGDAASDHAAFHRAMRTFASRSPRAPDRMARAALAALSSVLEVWRLDRRILTESPDAFNAFVHAAVAQIMKNNPAGRLTRTPLDLVRRRLYLTLTASLYRHVREPEAFRTAFGSVPEALEAIARDPAIFGQVMTVFSAQMPYFETVASQVFWRTLSNLDIVPETPDPLA